MEKAYIPKGMKITGDVKCNGDLLLAGEVVGDVCTEGTLELQGTVCGKNLKVGSVELSNGTIESDIECREHIGIESGVTIIGNVKAKSAEVNGAVMGNMDIAGELAVGPTAVLNGSVVAKDFHVDLGAICDIDLSRTYSDHRASDFFREFFDGMEEEEEDEEEVNDPEDGET